MGLLVDDSGHYRGWLAAFLCCCAALNEDEYPSEREKNKVDCKHRIVGGFENSTDNGDSIFKRVHILQTAAIDNTTFFTIAEHDSRVNQ